MLTPDIFDAIEKVGRNPHSGEVELTDALNLLAKTQPVLSAHYEGNWYEVGEPLGLVKASIQYALAHPEVKKEFKAYLKDQVIPALKRGEES